MDDPREYVIRDPATKVATIMRRNQPCADGRLGVTFLKLLAKCMEELDPVKFGRLREACLGDKSAVALLLGDRYGNKISAVRQKPVHRPSVGNRCWFHSKEDMLSMIACVPDGCHGTEERIAYLQNQLSEVHAAHDARVQQLMDQIADLAM